MSCKQKHKIDRHIKYNKISGIYCSMFMLQCHWNIEYYLSIHLFYGRFYLLTSSFQIVTKGCTYLDNPAVERCRFVQVYMALCTTSHKRANKIHVHGYPFGPARNY